jgi:hypothetical protein
MPNNAILLVGLGIAAFTLFRREESDVGETDLVDASMLSSGTGDTGKALSDITAIKSDEPIGGFPLVIPVTDTDVELPNVRTGPLPIIPVAPPVQTPVYIQTTGEQAGTAIQQLGIAQKPDDPKIYLEVIEMPGEEVVTPVTATSAVQIVPGGANLGEPYFTTLDTLVSAREQGYFTAPTWEQGIGPNVFDPQAAIDALAIMTAPTTYVGSPYPDTSNLGLSRVGQAGAFGTTISGPVEIDETWTSITPFPVDPVPAWAGGNNWWDEG